MAGSKPHKGFSAHVQSLYAGTASNGTGFFLSYYGLDNNDELSEEEGNGEYKGGKTFWEPSDHPENIGLSNDELMWGDSWINLQMKMIDMPHYKYKSKKDKEPEVKEGTVDILKNKFSKYVET